MCCAIATALRRLASEHKITSLPDEGLEDLLGPISAGDFDGMYEALGKVIAFFPVRLHERLFEVASSALPLQEEQDDQDEIVVLQQEDEAEDGERAGSPSGRSVTARCARNASRDDFDDEAFMEELRATVEAARREAGVGAGEMDSGEEGGEEGSGNDTEEHAMDGDNGSGPPDAVQIEANAQRSTSSSSSDEEEKIADYVTLLSRAITANFELEKSLQREATHLDELLTKADGHSSELREAHAALPGSEASSLQPSTAPAWTSMLGAADGYVSGAAVREEKLMSVAGALEWDVDRPFGTSYFAAEPNVMLCDGQVRAPQENADVTALRRRGVPSRATVVSAYCRMIWSMRERETLREALGHRLGSGGLRDEGKREKAKQWPDEVWESVADDIRAGVRKRTAEDVRNRAINVELAGGGVWTKAEDATLKKAVSVYTARADSGGWEGVARAVGGGRSGMDAVRRWRELEEMGGGRGRWSEEEDLMLIQATEKLGRGNWAAIGLVVGRPGQACMNRVPRHAKTRKVGKWGEEEMERLRKAVTEVGQNWVQVARRVGGRSNVQCREKWVNCEEDGIAKGPWKKEEDAKLKEMVEKEGKKWARVAEGMGGRTDAQCQKRWKRVCERREGDRGRKKRARKAAGGEGRGAVEMGKAREDEKDGVLEDAKAGAEQQTGRGGSAGDDASD